MKTIVLIGRLTAAALVLGALVNCSQALPDAAQDSSSSSGGGAGGFVVPQSTAPQITTQPAALTVNNFGAASFSVAATSNSAATYQWYFNGSAISGATSASYSIAQSRVANRGSYTVVVTNSAGSVTSGGAALTVNVPAPNGAYQTYCTDPNVRSGPCTLDSVNYTLACFCNLAPISGGFAQSTIIYSNCIGSTVTVAGDGVLACLNN
jgi:hypothetical protein